MKDRFRKLFTNVWNIPNVLTMLRIILIPVFVAVFFSTPHDRDKIAALVIFAAASITDMFDGMLDLAYNVEPVTRAMRVERLTAALEAMSEPRRRFAEIVLSNYVIDGVWKLNRATFTDVLNQLYHGNMPMALKDLDFTKPAEALSFFNNIQQMLYAA